MKQRIWATDKPGGPGWVYVEVDPENRWGAYRIWQERMAEDRRQDEIAEEMAAAEVKA